jgi:hypothetical protein
MATALNVPFWTYAMALSENSMALPASDFNMKFAQ